MCVLTVEPLFFVGRITGQAKDSDDEDEAESQRRAKRWEKKVKMRRKLRRALSEVEDNRSRFLDDDEESQSMLDIIKVSCAPRPPPRQPRSPVNLVLSGSAQIPPAPAR